MPATKFSALDLLDLAPLERGIVLRLARGGPVAVEKLAEELDEEPEGVERVVAALVAGGRLQRLADGRVGALFGRVGSRATLPPVLRPALATDRPYTQQEIATLRTAMPILQFARARMSQFADHGPAHALRVRSFAVQLSYLVDLTSPERHLLRIGALFHDVGNAVERKRHHLISQETVERLAAAREIPFSTEEAAIIGLLCRWHRGDYDPDRVEGLRGERIRTGLMASVLRVADAMDIDHRRSDYDDRFMRVLRSFYPEELPYWTSLQEIAGVRIRCARTVELEALTHGPAIGNMQIEMLRRDLASTPLPWSVRQFAMPAGTSARPAGGPADRAMLVFPFEPHSLVMAALSRAHLEAAGFAVEILCYPDTPGGSAWLWGEALAEGDPDGYARLVVIGDRPDPNAAPRLLSTIRRWQVAGAAVSVLNRFEANWPLVPNLIALGVDVTLGGDWACFWGDPTGPEAMAWARIAALSVRDPTYSSVGVTDQDRAVTGGLLRTVFDALAAPAPTDTAGWATLAAPILDRIAADDRAAFAARADGFAGEGAAFAASGHVEGRVLCLDRPPSAITPSLAWILEAAIEANGRAPERGLRFNVPHAIASWPDGDAVEILAITHWREEDAIPIRLLYPEGLGPSPQGNEHAVRVRVTTDLAPALVAALVAACNRTDDGLPPAGGRS